ncbi:MAG: glycosyltransferase family 4 protein [Clostridia bacterium]|nr:glycosyltransferase family 4 protein [Clostridia bacterium]
MSKGNILFLATVPSMITKFNTRNIRILQKMGYKIHAACNFDDRSAWTDEEAENIRKTLLDLDVTLHQIDFPRKPYHPILLVKSYKQLKKLLKTEDFEMMHNQSCVSGILGRICCRKKDIKIIHTEHGFYYFVGGPIYNWIFYPFDKMCSKWTDALITINRDDYEFAKKHMYAKKTVYIPGVGIDTEYYGNTVIDKTKMREALNVPKDAFVVLSVGELNKNKNHEIVLRAIAVTNKSDIYYVINGEGEIRDYLAEVAKSVGMSDRFLLTGNVKNVNEYYKMADIFAFPSKREGLGLAALEAMAAGLPLVTSNKNGINDYATDGVTGFMSEPDDLNGFKNAIEKLYESKSLREEMAKNNIERVKDFSEQRTDEIMTETYRAVMGNP